MGRWLPRLLVLSFAVSVFLPAPGFVTGLAHDEFLVWVTRVCWVVGVPSCFWALARGARRLALWAGREGAGKG